MYINIRHNTVTIIHNFRHTNIRNEQINHYFCTSVIDFFDSLLYATHYIYILIHRATWHTFIMLYSYRIDASHYGGRQYYIHSHYRGTHH